MKSRNTFTAPSVRPGLRMTSTSSSVTAAGSWYASRRMFPTVRSVATLPKNSGPTCEVRRKSWKALMNGLASAGCLSTCSMRRDGLRQTTPATRPGRSLAACSPAMLPTELQTKNTPPSRSPTTSSTKSLMSSAQL